LVRNFLLTHILFKFRTDFEIVDIQIKLFDEGNRFLYSITSINGQKLKRPVQRTRSPIAPIKFDGAAIFDAAKIPNGATHYCWLNGSNIIETDAIDAEPNEATMLLFGGLVYLDGDSTDNCQVVQINRFQPIDSGRFHLTGPVKWKSEYTQTLVNQDRFTVGFNKNISLSTP
jgi:hypothetical protein